MPHTPIADRIRTLAAAAHEADERGIAPEQALAERQQRRYSRRALLRATALPGAVTEPADPVSAHGARIVVVGAGLAGLTCAYRLAQAGVTATLYEASERSGGRCWTLRGAFEEDQVVERGGELIDTSHREIRRLARELDLELEDLMAAETPGTEAFYYVDGGPYTIAEATADFQRVWPRLKQDLHEAGYPTLYDCYTARGQALDRLSIADWIAQTVPGGLESRFGRLLNIAYTVEFGAETGDQSALNLLYLLGYSRRDRLQLYGESDERFRIRGGNDRLVSRLVGQLSGQILYGQELVALRESSGKRMVLTFRQGGGRMHDVVADKVVLALPFSVLRRSVDCSAAGFSALKKVAIQEQGMGNNAKLLAQFDRRLWRDLGNNGETFSDTGYQSTWEVTRAQAGAAGILVAYTGGAAAQNRGGNPLQQAPRFLGQIEPVLPGLCAQWNGFAHAESWPDHLWTRGSYSYWRVGQYTHFAGVERERSGNCLFAGEHTSVDFQGFLNGAVESGERAARQMLADLK